MAKWGEGDPRWIVEERPDATNVNNWHWSEKDATGWSKTRLKELLVGLKVENEEVKCEIMELSQCDGEASANNRKAKLIFFYEWEIKCKWKGSLMSQTDVSYDGELEVPNLSDENKPEDIVVSVSIGDPSEDALKIKEFMRTAVLGPVRDAVAVYITDLTNQYGQGLILPTSNLPPGQLDSSGLKNVKDLKIHSAKKPDVPQVASPPKGSLGNNIPTTSITLKDTFKCRAEDLFRALTLSEMVQAFTNGPCQVELSKNGKYSIYGGNVNGKFLDIVQNERLVMDWRMRSWPEGHYSRVVIILIEGSDATDLRVEQTGVPEARKEETEAGWNRHYFEAIKRTFGYGAYLL